MSADNILETMHINEKSPMYVLTNSSNVYEASALFYPQVQQKLAEALGESYYAIPSSVHEWLIVPVSIDISPENLAAMIKETNESVLDAKDILRLHTIGRSTCRDGWSQKRN